APDQASRPSTPAAPCTPRVVRREHQYAQGQISRRGTMRAFSLSFAFLTLKTWRASCCIYNKVAVKRLGPPGTDLKPNAQDHPRPKAGGWIPKLDFFEEDSLHCERSRRHRQTSRRTRVRDVFEYILKMSGRADLRAA